MHMLHMNHLSPGCLSARERPTILAYWLGAMLQIDPGQLSSNDKGTSSSHSTTMPTRAASQNPEWIAMLLEWEDQIC